MTSRHDPVIRSILPYVFQKYREHNYQIVLVKYDTGRENLAILTPSEVIDFEMNFTITKRFEKYEDIPEEHFKQFVWDFKQHTEDLS